MSAERFFALPAETHKVTMADTAGDNALHTVIRACRSAEEVATWLKDNEQKTEYLEKLAKETNKARLLPIDIVRIGTLKLIEKEKLYHLLLPLTSKHSIGDLRYIPDLKALDEKNLCHENLKIAHQIIKFTRYIIKNSATHPDFNTYSQDKKDEVIPQLQALKQAYVKVQDSILENNDEPTLQSKEYFLALVFQLCKKHQVGNCLEFSYLGLYYLNKYLGLSGDIFRIGNGDHWFLVIGRQVPSDENKPETWGDQAVICDSFVGSAYPAKAYLANLKDYRNIEIDGFEEVSCLVSFSPQDQFLECWLSCDSLKFSKNNEEKNVAQKRKLDKNILLFKDSDKIKQKTVSSPLPKKNRNT